MPRIHIFGASGSGVSTLGARIADLLCVPHIDSDRLYWAPTDPPFVAPRPLSERLALLQELTPATGNWVFSGSAIGWAAPIEPFYELIVFLRLDPAIRMDRLRRRELERYGARIEPGGDMAKASAAFFAWAAAYDTAGVDRRSRVVHERWLGSRTAPILSLDSSQPVEALARAVLSAVEAL